MKDNQGHCRYCNTPLEHSFCDLGSTPPSNSYITKKQLETEEAYHPLHAFVCSQCLLVQLRDYVFPENIFSDYAYFSSYSDSWLQHCKKYAEETAERLQLDPTKQVIEIASNDGYLLQFFKEKSIPILGIEPAANVAKVAMEKSIPTIVKFFGVQLASELKQENMQADLLIANNVLAHVPDLNDFVRGLKVLLKADGVITIEFPHLLRLLKENQFDTIYHEHFSYFSLLTLDAIFQSHGLKIWDVEELTTHGGSLRIYASHQEDDTKQIRENVARIKNLEIQERLDQLDGYKDFARGVEKLKLELIRFFNECKQRNQKIVGYGAPAKGNTLLSFCGIRSHLLDFTVDRSPHKQGRYLPGTHIPILSVDAIREAKPDYLFILPWNLKEEIMDQMTYIRDWGGKFVIPIPKLEVVE